MRAIEVNQQVVNDLAAIAGIKSPRLKVYGGRNAFYSPFTHRIYLSSLLAAEMDSDALRTLLAHEIGHARRRRKMLYNLCRFSVFPLASWLIWSALTITSYLMFGAGWQAMVALVTGLLLTFFIDQINTSFFDAARLIEEFSADRFAESVAWGSGAMEKALVDAARIENNGQLGSQAELRIVRLKNNIN